MFKSPPAEAEEAADGMDAVPHSSLMADLTVSYHKTISMIVLHPIRVQFVWNLDLGNTKTSIC